MTTTADVWVKVVDRLRLHFTDEGESVWSVPPEVPTPPAVWPEFTRGTGPDPKLSELAVTVVYLLRPQPNEAQWPTTIAVVDELHAAFADQLSPAIAYRSRVARVDTLELGRVPDAVTYDAVFYDLVLAHNLTC